MIMRLEKISTRPFEGKWENAWELENGSDQRDER
jgi:hypothetical protein